MLVKKIIFMICPAGSFFRYPLPRLAKRALPNISVGIRITILILRFF